MAIERVGVVGCGLMGSGIAETCARAGYRVVVREVSADLLARGLARIDASLGRAVERGKLDQAAARAARERIRGTVDLADLRECDLVIEAVVELMAEKKAVFGELDRLCPPHTWFASNTSSLSITEMAAATGRPERVVGMHFFNPVPVMPLVEVVRGLRTAEATVEAAKAFAATLGKRVVVVKDSPGFIVNRLLVPYLLDAVRALELGVASREDIDTAVTLGLNHPMGPLTLLDFVGLDTTYYIAQAMYEEFRDPRYAPPPLLRRMVLAGYLGRKTGRGFYEYEPPPGGTG
ncbi:MAG: 3-hydroxybutyryl-CoA dehydrogenase [Armatimonadota bacterium]|nr:3-hydroxybutyryl-CoA dehydrogenase [Armatimonadota bacterium]MDR7447644.1 3-hydroxybutyryl-CoA dehydrogenase [Armatimonadota bacterium]MDR7459475.1 3-hydroxybutyryl-CoA dehydrogenase [Armatimonadota bacterium]MDR7480081.1 3-hydroxybutyryl-CoA dehydrogenase [Armatimonadota bacterium]MDR7488788.1 3-hydroxybutyryl-CoA dehydrogenase [Armatimonadota bacterium]